MATRIQPPRRFQQVNGLLNQTEAEINSAFNRNGKPNPVVRAIREDINRVIEDPSNTVRELIPEQFDQFGQIQQTIQQTIATSTPPRTINSLPENISINTLTFGAQTLAQIRNQTSGIVDSNTEIAQAARQSIINSESDIPGDPSDPSPISGGVEETRTVETRTDDIDLIRDIEFEPNPLNSLDNPTYGWRFFMSNPQANHDNISNQDIAIIAETGSTGFYITDAKINTIISPGPSNRNAFATQINFTVIEPQGNTLFDRIRLAAIDLGVDDHRNVPLWLELSFRGYTGPQENSEQGGLPQDLVDQKRLWQVKVRAVDIEIDKGGTEYSFMCIPFNEIGYQDSARRAEKKIDLNVTTLRDFFEGLGEELNRNNNNSTKRSIDNIIRTRSYAFKLPNDQELRQIISQATRLVSSGNVSDNLSTNNVKPMIDWEIRGSNSAFNKRSQTFNESEIENGRWHISFNGGDPIEAMVQEIIGTTVEGQSLAIYGSAGGNVEDIQAAIEQRDPKIPSIVFSVEPITEIVSYNDIAKDYNILITYHVRPYITFQPILSREHLERAAKGETGKQRFERQLIISQVRKKYEYMYSGLNTDVLDYRIRFDRAWFLSLPIFQGQDRNAVGLSSGSMTDVKSQLQIIQEDLPPSQTNPAALKSLSNRLDQARGQLQEDISNNILSDGQIGARQLELRNLEEEFELRANFGSTREQLRELSNIPIQSNRINTSSFGADRLTTIRNPVISNSDGSNVNFLTTAQDSNFIFRGAEREVGIAITNDLGRRTSNRDGVGSATFVEERDTISTGRDISKSRNEEIIDVGTEISPTRRPNESNIEGTVGKGRSFFSAIMNQIYGAQGQMINVEVEIRGDPYWLGETNPNKKIQGITDRDLTKSDTLMLMTFDFPTSQGDGGAENSIDSYSGSGLFDIQGNRQNGFNGLYYIRKVESVFSNGRFTQKLIGHADPLTQEINVKRVARASNRNNR